MTTSAFRLVIASIHLLVSEKYSRECYPTARVNGVVGNTDRGFPRTTNLTIAYLVVPRDSEPCGGPKSRLRWVSIVQKLIFFHQGRRKYRPGRSENQKLPVALLALRLSSRHRTIWWTQTQGLLDFNCKGAEIFPLGFRRSRQAVRSCISSQP